MALSLLRCSRLNSAFSFTRLVLNQNVALARFCRTRPEASITAGRFYSSQRKDMVVVLNLVFRWCLTRAHDFLLKTYKDVGIKDLTDATKQAFSHVSGLLSRCQFEAMKGLVAEDLIRQLEEKCCSLPPNYMKSLSAGPNDIVETSPGSVTIFNNNDRKFLRVEMHFWYWTSACCPEDLELPGSPMFKGTNDKEESKDMLCATYEFQRELTQGVAPNWTITDIKAGDGTELQAGR